MQRPTLLAKFSRFVCSVFAPRRENRKIGPLTRELSGIVKVPRDKDYTELVSDALAEKFRREWREHNQRILASFHGPILRFERPAQTQAWLDTLPSRSS